MSAVAVSVTDENAVAPPLTDASAPDDDVNDPLRRFAGFGVLLRRKTGVGATAEWSCLNLADVRKHARRRLPKGIFEFIDRGAEDDEALAHNREAAM